MGILPKNLQCQITVQHFPLYLSDFSSVINTCQIGILIAEKDGIINEKRKHEAIKALV
jgi:hypothetical protein